MVQMDGGLEQPLRGLGPETSWMPVNDPLQIPDLMSQADLALLSGGI